MDDSGSKTTGKYQGSLTFSADNPFGLSDLFYLSYSRHLGHTDAHTDSEGKKTTGDTQSYAFHYSVPAGNWLWSWNHNYYRYHQAVAGINEVYDYNGKSRGSDIGFTRLLYRDARRKSHIGFKLWQKENQSFIDDAEVEVQRRKTAGWQLSLKHKEYIGRSTLDIGLGYKRGTGMADAIAAPEEVFDEGTSRMKVITADISYNHPFQIGRQHFVYDTALHAHLNTNNSKLQNSTQTISSDTIIKDGSHFDQKGKLKPNVTYQAGEFEYIYQTDHLGRLKTWEAQELQLTKRSDRLHHNPNTPGKLSGDHAGHLAGDRFGGSPKLDNLVSQLSGVNLSNYKILENEWANALMEKKRVTVNVDIQYKGNSLRPDHFVIQYEIDGIKKVEKIYNTGK